MDTLILGVSPEKGVLMGRPSKYPVEFREQAIELVKTSDKPLAHVARDLGINDTTLGNWVKADATERGQSDSTGQVPPERAGAGRADPAAPGERDAADRGEILQRVAACFMKESTR